MSPGFILISVIVASLYWFLSPQVLLTTCPYSIYWSLGSELPERLDVWYVFDFLSSNRSSPTLDTRKPTWFSRINRLSIAIGYGSRELQVLGQGEPCSCRRGASAVRGNNRSVMPLDVLDRTRATLTEPASSDRDREAVALSKLLSCVRGRYGFSIVWPDHRYCRC